MNGRECFARPDLWMWCTNAFPTLRQILLNTQADGSSDAAQLAAFRREGALLVRGTKQTGR